MDERAVVLLIDLQRAADVARAWQMLQFFAPYARQLSNRRKTARANDRRALVKRNFRAGLRFNPTSQRLPHARQQTSCT